MTPAAPAHELHGLSRPARLDRTSAKTTRLPGSSHSQAARRVRVFRDDGTNPLNAGTFTVPLDAPGTLLTPRVTQLDLSFSKRITVKGVKFDPKIDIFNALNSDDYFSVRGVVFSPTTNPALTTPVTRGSAGTYLQPNAILQGRIIRVAAVITW